MLSLWIGTFLAEFLLYKTSIIWTHKKTAAFFLGLYILTASILLMPLLGKAANIMLGLLALYRIGNLMRVMRARMEVHYLSRATSRSALWIFLTHCMVIVLFVLPFDILPDPTIASFMYLQLAVATGVIFIILHSAKKLTYTIPRHYLTDRELPTVTVAIPARNETTDLEACLRAILANDYPKLEIIVLDDCSQDKTAEVIRSFAHDGVRFIKGQEPDTGWLARNHACQKLSQEASGDLILFCSVNVRLGPKSIRSMINHMYDHNKSMLSVLPVDAQKVSAGSAMQPLVYWSQLALPRRLFNKPAVVSSCWMIGRQDLEKLGGFAAVKHSVVPENYFASELVKTNQYALIRSSGELEVVSSASFQDQKASYIRNLYPQLRRRPEQVFLVSFFLFNFLLLPFILLPLSLWVHALNAWLLLLTCIALVIAQAVICGISKPGKNPLMAAAFPLSVGVEIALLYISMLQYEFFTVEWKDRNICIPVMHIYHKLPAIPES